LAKQNMPTIKCRTGGEVDMIKNIDVWHEYCKTSWEELLLGSTYRHYLSNYLTKQCSFPEVEKEILIYSWTSVSWRLISWIPLELYYNQYLLHSVSCVFDMRRM
jgi:hypothetical protein